MKEIENCDAFSEWKNILSSLNKREAEVIAYRFGLLGVEPSTLEQVGQRMGVTRERIRQIEAKALRKMRYRALALGANIHDYVDD